MMNKTIPCAITKFDYYNSLPYSFSNNKTIEISVNSSLPADVEACSTPLMSASHRVRCAAASACSIESRVSRTSLTSRRSVSQSNKLNSAPSRPWVPASANREGVSLPDDDARVRACSDTSPASLWASCKQETAARRSNRCGQHRVSCKPNMLHQVTDNKCAYRIMSCKSSQPNVSLTPCSKT